MGVVKTADLCDLHAPHVQVVQPIFRDYGSLSEFHGQMVTVKVHEDNKLVRDTLEQRGNGKVLVVDGGGSLRCGLIGDNVAEIARNNGWSGVVVYGCVRDSAQLADISIGLKALNTNPFRSAKWGNGQRDITVRFAGVVFEPGHYLYADEDGIILAPHPLM